MRTSFLLCAAASAILVTSLPAAVPGNAADGIGRGPFFSGTIMQKGGKVAAANKGIVITVGAEKRAYICYDTDTMRAAMGWTGDYLEFGNTQTQIAWPPPPVAKGQLVFETKVGPGWAKPGVKGDDGFKDPRHKQQGPLPEDWAKWKGIYVNGEQVILSYTVGKASVLEMPSYNDEFGAFIRIFEVSNANEAMNMILWDKVPDGIGNLGFILTGQQEILEDKRDDGRLLLHITPNTRDFHFCVVKFFTKDNSAENGERLKARVAENVQKIVDKIESNLQHLTKGSKPLFPEPVVTQGTLGSGDAPYVVDEITPPVPNPWNAKTFFGGFDFFPDGRAAICTFHGDVWIVSGIDDKLDKLTWRRFATGLFQPLGLKIVDNKIYVLGRDQITRLHDLNNDGEADFYENFNNDTVVTPNYHEFCLDLHTDSKGNFLFMKGAPWTPAVESPHQGTLLRVSKDGSKMEVVATGFRAPNGMTVGPHDEILTGDNQGHWMPSSKLNLIRPGGFYGMTPAAQRELTLTRNGTNIVINPSDPEARARVKLAGWDKDAPIPTSYDQPICWVPYGVDNSSGGQTYVTSDKWGPFKGHPLFQSYGKCTLFNVMTEEVGGVTQAAMWQFPLKFNSGIMRARFNPKDGQLYQCGLKGWQTSATKDGGFYRVRFTGKPVNAPAEFHVKPNGVAITFTCALDESLATDTASWSVEQWNYIYSGNYGSPEVSTDDPNKRQHDKVEVKSVKLSADKKTVLLEMPVKPVQQMRVKFNLKTADGASLISEVFNTIHKVPAK